jgi:DNA primase
MAGRIPRSFIDDLLTRVDIVDIVDARVKLKKQGKKLRRLLSFSQ